MFGYYGKIPAQGDFIRAHADVGFVQGWDRWLQNGMTASRAQLGEGWQQAYENAPIWRFCLGAQVCGAKPVIGIMMPSMDRVGRCFPLTLFLRLKQAVAPEALEVEPIMTRFEDAALASLEQGADKNTLEHAMAGLVEPDLPLAAQNPGSHWLSTFFGGTARRDQLAFAGLPDDAAFADLLNPDPGPDKGGENV